MSFLNLVCLLAAATAVFWLWRSLAERRLARYPALWQADWPFMRQVRLARRHLALHGWKMLPRLGLNGHVWVHAEKNGVPLYLRMQNRHTTNLKITIQDALHTNATDAIAVGILATDHITDEHRKLATSGNLYIIAPTELAQVERPAREALTNLRKRQSGEAKARAAKGATTTT